VTSCLDILFPLPAPEEKKEKRKEKGERGGGEKERGQRHFDVVSGITQAAVIETVRVLEKGRKEKHGGENQVRSGM